MGTEVGMGVGRVVMGCRKYGSSVGIAVRYANDLMLTDIARRLTNDMADLNHLLTNGRLDSAFLIAHEMEQRLESLKERLNDIKYRRT